MDESAIVPNGEIPKKPRTMNYLVTNGIIGLVLLIAFLIIFFSPNLNGTSTGSSPQASGGNTGIPPAVLMPIADITTQSVTCQVTGVLDITGTVKNNVNRPLSVEIAAAGYDSEGDVRGAGYDTVVVDPHGMGSFAIAITDGCMLGETGMYDVRIVDINWRHTD